MTAPIRSIWVVGLVALMGFASTTHGTAGSSPASAPRASTPCQGPDRISDFHIWTLQHGAAKTDSEFVAHWAQSGFLPVSASEITLVTEPTTCAAAVAAFNAAAVAESPLEPQAVSLYVVRVGPRYDTFDPAIGDGEFITHRIFDTTFVHLKTYVR